MMMSEEEGTFSTSKMLGDGHQAKVYVAKTPGKSPQCVKIFEPFKDVDTMYNAEIEFKVAQSLVGHPNIV